MTKHLLFLIVLSLQSPIARADTNPSIDKILIENFQLEQKILFARIALGSGLLSYLFHSLPQQVSCEISIQTLRKEVLKNSSFIALHSDRMLCPKQDPNILNGSHFCQRTTGEIFPASYYMYDPIRYLGAASILLAGGAWIRLLIEVL